MKKGKLTAPEKQILWGIPVLFIVGALFHFLYDICRQCIVIAAIAPINESVWEHCKMVVVPLILWWLSGLFFIGKEKSDKDKWLTSALFSLLISISTMPMLFYFYTGAFGVELLLVDCALLLVSIALGQLLGLHYYRHGKGISYIAVLIILGLIVAAFVLLTFFTPKLPIFTDAISGLYGITY